MSGQAWGHCPYDCGRTAVHPYEPEGFQLAGPVGCPRPRCRGRHGGTAPTIAGARPCAPTSLKGFNRLVLLDALARGAGAGTGAELLRLRAHGRAPLRA